MTMGNWSVYVPEQTVNACLNPSAETTGNFAASGGATVTRSTSYQFRGPYSFRVQGSGAGHGAQFTVLALANAAHYASLFVYGTIPDTFAWSLDNGNWHTPTLIETYGSWYHYGVAFPAAQANGSTLLYVRQGDADATDYYIDCIQVEAKAYWTSYCDGDQSGCYWSGVPHASTSTRSAQYRGGGRLYDIDDTYGVYTTMMSGFGLQDPTLNIQEGALLDGGWFQSSKVGVRMFVL